MRKITNHAGKQLSAGLPNIKGHVGRFRQGVIDGAFKYYQGSGHTKQKDDGDLSVEFNAYNGETKLDGTYKGENDYKVYGKSETVQPAAVVMNYIIRYI